MEMEKIVSNARKRRAKLLKHFNRLNINVDFTVTKFAELYSSTDSTMTRSRMSKLLIKAKEENV